MEDNVFVDCVCEGPKMPGLTHDQIEFILQEFEITYRTQKDFLCRFMSRNHPDISEEFCKIFIDDHVRHIAMIEEILDCLREMLD